MKDDCKTYSKIAEKNWNQQWVEWLIWDVDKYDFLKKTFFLVPSTYTHLFLIQSQFFILHVFSITKKNFEYFLRTSNKNSALWIGKGLVSEKLCFFVYDGIFEGTFIKNGSSFFPSFVICLFIRWKKVWKIGWGLIEWV